MAQVVLFGTNLPIQDPHEVELPPDGSPAIELLPRAAGLSCRGCRYLTVSRKKMTDHCRRCGGSVVDGDGWREVSLQSFSQGRYARY